MYNRKIHNGSNRVLGGGAGGGDSRRQQGGHGSRVVMAAGREQGAGRENGQEVLWFWKIGGMTAFSLTFFVRPPCTPSRPLGGRDRNRPYCCPFRGVSKCPVEVVEVVVGEVEVEVVVVVRRGGRKTIITGGSSCNGQFAIQVQKSARCPTSGAKF